MKSWERFMDEEEERNAVPPNNQQIADFLDGLLERQRDDSDCLVLDGYEQDEIAAFAKDIRAVPPNTQDGLREALERWANARHSIQGLAGPHPCEACADLWGVALSGAPDGPYGTQDDG